MTYIQQARSINARIFDTANETRRSIAPLLILGYGAAFLAIGTITALSPLAPAVDNGVYQLVQIDGDESDIIDYNLSSDDCRQQAVSMARKGYHVLCEVAE